MNIMKNLIKILFILSSFIMAAGCQSEGARYVDQLVGDWCYEGNEGGVQETVWLSFSEDRTFEMFQKIGDGAYRSVSGVFGVDAAKKTISGIYEDNYPWKYDYGFSVEGDVLVLTAVQLESYKVTYRRRTIPAEVRAMSIPLTKSDSFERAL